MSDQLNPLSVGVPPERIAAIEREVDDKLSVYTSDGATPMERAIFRNQVRGFFIESLVRAERQVAEAQARLAKVETLTAALRHADKFIRNGIELGYITMPDPDCPDTAHDTPRIVREALASVSPPPSSTDE